MRSCKSTLSISNFVRDQLKLGQQATQKCIKIIMHMHQNCCLNVIMHITWYLSATATHKKQKKRDFKLCVTKGEMNVVNGQKRFIVANLLTKKKCKQKQKNRSG